jgi:hypothetical protein
MLTLVKKILNIFFNGGDEAHETLKSYNYRPEKGYVSHRNGGFVWVTEKKATWQTPKKLKVRKDFPEITPSDIIAVDGTNIQTAEEFRK